MRSTKHRKSEAQLVREEKMIDSLLARGWERGWISPAIRQQFLREAEQQKRVKASAHLLAGVYD